MTDSDVVVFDDKDTEFTKQHWPFYWIHRADSLYIQTLEKKLKQENLSIVNWRILMLLSSERKRSIGYLSRESLTKQPTVTKIIQRMSQDQLVTINVAVKDKRIKEILLTNEGLKAQAKAAAYSQEIIQNVFSDVNAEDAQIMVQTLAKIVEGFRAGAK